MMRLFRRLLRGQITGLYVKVTHRHRLSNLLTSRFPDNVGIHGHLLLVTYYILSPHPLTRNLALRGEGIVSALFGDGFRIHRDAPIIHRRTVRLDAVIR